MRFLFASPTGATQLSIGPQLASWDRAGSPSQVRLEAFLAQVDRLSAPMIAGTNGRLAVELVVGLPDGVPLTEGGRDLDNYLYPVAQRLGGTRIAAMFGRKVHGPSTLAIGPAEPGTEPVRPSVTIRVSGSYVRRKWKEDLRQALLALAVSAEPGPVVLDLIVTTGPGRNIDSFGPVLDEEPGRPFHPLDDRVTSLGLHHHIDSGIGHDVIIEVTWKQARSGDGR